MSNVHNEAIVMPSELKPWRYVIKYGPEGEDAYSWVYDDHGAMVATMKTHKAKQIVDTMNTHQEATVMASEYCKFPHCECSMGAAERCKRIRTRPAPAATDTGLVTYDARSITMALTGTVLLPSPDGEYVTRSQAEDLLVAERAEKRIWMGKAAIEAERVERLEADNAAKDARIKELENSRQRSIKQYEIDMLQQFELRKSLEDKLAAALAVIKEFQKEFRQADLPYGSKAYMLSLELRGKPS